MANFTIMRNGLNTEIVGDPHIGQSSEDVTVAVNDDGTYSGYAKRLYYSYCYHNELHRALSAVNSNGEFVIPVQAFFEPGMVKLSVELSNGTNCPACNACFLIVTDGAKDVDTSVLPSEKTWQSYIQSYIKSDVYALGERIDNLILSSGSESSAEVIDARTGYDGTSYNTLGTALRTQINNLKSNVDLIKEIGLSSKINFSTGGLNPGDGSITDNAERLHSDIIFVRKGSNIKLKPNKKLKFAVYKYGDLLGNEFISATALSLDDYIFTEDCYIRILIETGDTTRLKDIDFELFAFDLELFAFDLNELNNRVKYTELTEWTNNGYIPISDVNNYTKFAITKTREWAFMVLPVHSGDKFIIYGYGGKSSRLYAFTDKFGKVLERTEKTNVMQKLVITSPSDGYVIFNVLQSNEHQVIKFNTNVINENNKRNLIIPPYMPSAYNPMSSVPNSKTTAMTYEEIVESWDNLQKKYPDYISKTNLGKETSGTLDMYRYDFVPEIVPLEAAVLDGMNKIYTKNDYPVVIMGACIHGAERPCAKALLNLMTLIANAKDYSILGWLRNNIHFVIIPLENPWGYKNNKRTNVNQVDLNRNFEPFWEKGDDTTENQRYRGTAPLSEKETQYIDSILNECADKAVCYYSFHTHGVFTSYSMMTNFSSPAMYLLNDMQNIGMSVTKMITTSGWTNHNLPENSGYIGCMEMEYGSAMASYQGAKYNIPSACPEVMYRYYDGGTSEVYNTDLDCMNTEYILYAVANACKKFLYGN